jgi:hypothetical protein
LCLLLRFSSLQKQICYESTLPSTPSSRRGALFTYAPHSLKNYTGRLADKSWQTDLLWKKNTVE